MTTMVSGLRRGGGPVGRARRWAAASRRLARGTRGARAAQASIRRRAFVDCARASSSWRWARSVRRRAVFRSRGRTRIHVRSGGHVRVRDRARWLRPRQLRSRQLRPRQRAPDRRGAAMVGRGGIGGCGSRSRANDCCAARSWRSDRRPIRFRCSPSNCRSRAACSGRGACAKIVPAFDALSPGSRMSPDTSGTAASEGGGHAAPALPAQSSDALCLHRAGSECDEFESSRLACDSSGGHSPGRTLAARRADRARGRRSIDRRRCDRASISHGARRR